MSHETVAAREMVPFNGPVHARVRPPGSKSFTNRALITAALASGKSTLRGFLDSDDTHAMVGCLLAMDIKVWPPPSTQQPSGYSLAGSTSVSHSSSGSSSVTASSLGPRERVVTVEGCASRPQIDGRSLNVRQSGTTTRFIVPFAALGQGTVQIDGDPQMRARPNTDLIGALRDLGSRVETPNNGFLPFSVVGSGMHGGTVDIAGDVSSQFLSGLLLSAPCFREGLTVRVVGELVSKPYVDITLSTMRAFGAEVAANGYESFMVKPTGYRATDYSIEPDASAASYLFSVAAICGGSVTVEGLGTNAQQGDVKFVDALERMGLQVTRSANATTVTNIGVLRGIDIDMVDISDTAQTLAAVAVFADGPTRVRGVEFMRRKEIDRVAAVPRELNRCGIEATEHHDGFTIVPGMPKPATIQTSDDHRMAMSFALLGLRAPGIRIDLPGCVAKTFPEYFAVLETMRPT
jgi:3-phosphoshikimate 1-carboxyvinyltransferase